MERKIDSTTGKGIPEDVTKEELMKDQHRHITEEEKKESEEILRDFKSGKSYEEE